MPDFTGPGTPLTETGLEKFITATSTGTAELWSVVAVETSGCGFLPDRRPKILFERHVFSTLTGGRYDTSNPDISQPTPGGYGAGGANQYNRLAEAMMLDSASALQSASWGLGQIMGQNYLVAGFASVNDMVDAMVRSEDNQLIAMANFLVNRHLARPLAEHDWVSFALGYNGAGYAAHNYNGLLAHFYGIYSVGNQPDLQVRLVQIYLTYKGKSPGVIDGRFGPNTEAAVKAFQAANGLPSTGEIDGDLLAKLCS